MTYVAENLRLEIRLLLLRVLTFDPFNLWLSDYADSTDIQLLGVESEVNLQLAVQVFFLKLVKDFLNLLLRFELEYVGDLPAGPLFLQIEFH